MICSKWGNTDRPPGINSSPLQGACMLAFAGSVMLALTGCDSGGKSSGDYTFNPPTSANYTPGVFAASANFKGQCSATEDQNNWLRSWTNETYLFYSEAPDRDPASYSTPNYFALMRSTAITSAGVAKDPYHFAVPTDDQLTMKQAGIEMSYGLRFVVLQSTPPRNVVVAHVEPGSAAAAAGVFRGDTVRTVDGNDLINGNAVNALSAGLFPSALNESHQFTLRDTAGTDKDVTLTTGNITLDAVHVSNVIATDTGPVGYISFNNPVATAEAELIAAITDLKAQNVQDLVLDLRYNGGGLPFDFATGNGGTARLYIPTEMERTIVNELAYMIAGPDSTSTPGFPFEVRMFNDKSMSANVNPVTGDPLAPTPFYTTAQLGNGNAPLPTLNLPRVFVLTGGRTCAASEVLINGLLGVNLDVIQIGNTTCGQPYGFYPTDNCGTTYFSIQYQNANASGTGDFLLGFSPQDTTGTQGTLLPGCTVADDFSKQFGDPAEARLAAALFYRANDSTCPTSSTSSASKLLTRF